MKQIKLLTLLVLTLLLTACPSKRSSSSAPVGAGILTPGSFTGSVNEIIRSNSYRPVGSSQEVELGLRLFAPNSSPIAAGQTYVGPVLAQGYLDVRSANWNGCTVIPLGRYTIRTPVANGHFSPDIFSTPWNLTNFNMELVHTSGYVAQLRVDYAEFRDIMPAVTGVDGLQYVHTMYGQTILSTPVSPVSCYWGPVTLFFPWSF